MSIKETLAQIDKKFGLGTVMFYGDTPKTPVDVISTSLSKLDKILGIGGLPRGRIVEVYGPESSGKTTLTLHVLAECQKKGGQVAFVDVEHALDPVYAKNLGVDIDNMLLSQPDSGEQALEVVEMLVRSGDVQVVVLDSIAALSPRAELDGEMGDQLPGKHAKLVGQALRKLTHIVSKNNCLVIFINQLREKIGVIYGSPEVTPGGKAMKFYASVRLDIRRIASLKNSSDEVIGNRTRIKIVKNKFSPPFKEVEFDIIFGEGISKESDLLDLAIEEGIITKGGAWFNYKDKPLAQGREKARIALKDPVLFEEIKALTSVSA